MFFKEAPKVHEEIIECIVIKDIIEIKQEVKEGKERLRILTHDIEYILTFYN